MDEKKGWVWRFSLAVVVPVPLYAVEKLAKLFFPLSPSVCTFSLSSSSASALFPVRPVKCPKASEGLAGFHRTLGPRPGFVGEGRGERRKRRTQRERRKEGAFTSSISVSEVSIDPSANEFCNPIKTFPPRCRNKVPLGGLSRYFPIR